MSDIVKVLEAIDHGSVEDCFLQSPMFAKADDEITRLRAALASAEVRVWNDAIEAAAKVAERTDGTRAIADGRWFAASIRILKKEQP